MRRFAMSRNWACARLSRLVCDGLLVQRPLLYRQPGVYLATAEGLRWTRIQRLGVQRIGAGGFEQASAARHHPCPDTSEGRAVGVERAGHPPARE